MHKLIAILNVIAWGGFWAFGYLALTAGVGHTGQMITAALLAAMGGGVGMLAFLWLVRHAEAVARERGIPRVFALSNRAADFFTGKLGYSPASVEALPRRRREQFEASGRDSLVFSHPLS